MAITPPSPHELPKYQTYTTIPFDQNTATGRLALTTASAATSGNLAAGVYVVRLAISGTGLCYLAFGATATLPTNGAAPAAGTTCVSDGEMIKAPGGTQLAGILSGTGTTGELAFVQVL